MGDLAGFPHWVQPSTQPPANLPSGNPEVIVDYLKREVSRGRMFVCPSETGIHISPMGVIPKKNKPGKWQLIVDLSAPEGGSVNDGISREQSTLVYSSVDHLSALVLTRGRGAHLIKADIKEAYRMVPVHRDDQPLLGISWQGVTYVDRVLPFGLRSALKIFMAIADTVQWVLARQGVLQSLHYLDDYIVVAGDATETEQVKHILVSVFESLGVPMELSKLEGPSTCLVYLGIEVGTKALLLRLPKGKLVRLAAELREAVGRKSMTKRELQSLTGLLQHAAKVCLNLAAHADIVWWHVFVHHWNGTSML